MTPTTATTTTTATMRAKLTTIITQLQQKWSVKRAKRIYFSAKRTIFFTCVLLYLCNAHATNCRRSAPNEVDEFSQKFDFSYAKCAWELARWIYGTYTLAPSKDIRRRQSWHKWAPCTSTHSHTVKCFKRAHENGTSSSSSSSCLPLFTITNEILHQMCSYWAAIPLTILTMSSTHLHTT